MILAFMLYGCITGLVIAVVGWLAERAMQNVGAPVRWIWIWSAIASAAVLGFTTFEYVKSRQADAALFSNVAQPDAGSYQDAITRDSPSSIEPHTSTSWLTWRNGLSSWVESQRWFQRIVDAGERWNVLIVWTWSIASVLLLFMLLGATAWRHRRAELGEETRIVDGVPVRVSSVDAPAAIGVRRSFIVLPAWALELDPHLRSLIVRHEQEHVIARDPALLLAVTMLVVLMPWHLPLWWCLRRMRLAIEMDCDARVLRRYPDIKRYARLLLLVSQHLRPTWQRGALQTLAATNLQPSPTHLRKRIVAMTRPPMRHPWRVTVLSLTCCAALTAVAFALPAPGSDPTKQGRGEWQWTSAKKLPNASLDGSAPRATVQVDVAKVRVGIIFNNPCGYRPGAQIRRNEQSVDVRFFDQERPQSERDALDTMCPKVHSPVAYEAVVGGLAPGQHTINVYMGRSSRNPSPASAVAREKIEIKPYRVYALVVVSVHLGVNASNSVQVYTTDSAQLSAEAGSLSLVSDTLHLTPPAAINADVTQGEVHFVSGVPIDVKASFENGLARTVTATGRHVVLLRGGEGIGAR